MANFFVFNAMPPKLYREQKISFSINKKYFDFVGDKYFLGN